MEFISQMSSLEVFTECYLASLECDLRMAEWDKALTKEQNEKAEDNFYLAQEHWSLVMREIKRRGLENEYYDYANFVCGMRL